MDILLFVLAVVLLSVVSSRWGADSRDNIDSREWERRRGGRIL